MPATKRTKAAPTQKKEKKVVVEPEASAGDESPEEEPPMEEPPMDEDESEVRFAPLVVFLLSYMY